MDPAGAYLPAVGEAVVLKNDGVILFAGSIDSRTWDNKFTTGRFIKCQCVNLALALDRRLVARAFVNMTTDDIIRAVITGYLTEEGISEGTLDPGPLITKAVYNYLSASRVMDEIADLTGYSWSVDQFGQLHMRNRATVLAPWNISDSTAPVLSFTPTDTRANYGNRQWLRAGQGTTDTRTESFKGDGVRQTFTTKFPMATAPTVTVNAVAKTVGIRQVDTGKDYYWNKGDKEITQDDAATALTTSDVLAVTYTGFYPIMVRMQDIAQVNARQAVEGGTGIYERIETDESIEDVDLAQDKTAGLLRKFATIQGIVNYTTQVYGLRAGQLQNIVQTQDTVSGDYLLADVTITYDVALARFVYTVKALSGEQLGGWQAFFRKLFASGNRFTLRENEVVLQAFSVGDNLLFTDAINFIDPISTGSDDPLTTAWVSDATQYLGHQFRVGISRLGRDYFS